MPKPQTKRWRDRVLKQTGGGRGVQRSCRAPSASRPPGEAGDAPGPPALGPLTGRWGRRRCPRLARGPVTLLSRGALEDTGLACRPRRSRHSSQPGLPSRSRLLEGACPATSTDLKVLERLAREPRLFPYPWGYVRGPDWCLKPQIVPNPTYTMLFSTCPYDKVCQAGRARD